MGESASFDGGSSELPTRGLTLCVLWSTPFPAIPPKHIQQKQGQESKDDKNTTSTFKIIQIQTQNKLNKKPLKKH